MNLEVKDIEHTLEKEINKYKITLSKEGKEADILLEGKGKIKTTIEV